MHLPRLFLASVIYLMSVDQQKAWSIAISGKYRAESSGDVRQRVFPGLSGSGGNVQHMLQARGPSNTGLQDHKQKESKKKATQKLQGLKSMGTALDETGRASDKDKKGVDRYIERLTSILTNFTDKHKNGKQGEKSDGTKTLRVDVVKVAFKQDGDRPPDLGDKEEEHSSDKDGQISDEDEQSEKTEKVSAKDSSAERSKKDFQKERTNRKNTDKTLVAKDKGYSEYDPTQKARKIKKNNPLQKTSWKRMKESKKMKKNAEDSNEDSSKKDNKKPKSRRPLRVFKHKPTRRSPTRFRSGKSRRSVEVLELVGGGDGDDNDDNDDGNDDYDDEAEEDMELVQALRSRSQAAGKGNSGPGKGETKQIEILQMPEKDSSPDNEYDDDDDDSGPELLQVVPVDDGKKHRHRHRHHHRHHRPHYDKIEIHHVGGAPQPAPAAAAPPAPAAAPPPAGAPTPPPGGPAA